MRFLVLFVKLSRFSLSICRLTVSVRVSVCVLLGPEDSLWTNYMKEVDDWLYSKDFNAGVQLFKIVEEKIMGEMEIIFQKRREAIARRTRFLKDLIHDGTRVLQENYNLQLNATELIEKAKLKEYQYEHDTFHGDSSDDRIYLYLASDNDRVKEAFAHYLVGHANISVMRVDTGHHIVHAKDINYLKSAGNNGTMVFNLAMDWYSLSLSNIVFAWRRDTHLTSTFAQVD